MNKQKKNQQEPLSRKVGDKVERAGEKLKDIGANKVGQKVYETGNKIEHSQDDEK